VSETPSATSPRAFWVSATAHGIVVAVFATLSLARGCVRPSMPREIITYIDVTSALPPPAPSLLPPLRDVPPPPDPRPPPRNIPEPRPTPPAPPRPRVEPSTQRVVRAPSPTPSQPRRPALTPEQIRDQLSRGLPTAAPMAAREDFPFGWYFAQVKQAMYEAWIQPSGVSAAAGHVVQVLIRVERDGTVSHRQIVKPSGNPLMDDSVQRAIESVRKLRPLPDQYRGLYRDITIEFELTGGAG